MADRDRMINQRPSNDQERNENRSLARRGGGLSGYSGWASPFELIRRFSEDVDRMFGSMGLGNLGSSSWPLDTARQLSRQAGTAGAGVWAPSVDVLTRGDDLVIAAELPGIKPEEVDIEVDENGLVLSGETRSESKRDEQGYWYSERRYGSFYRRIPLPAGVNAENASAQFNNGVLEITLPGAAKQIQPQRRRIEIEGAGQSQDQQQSRKATQPQTGEGNEQSRSTSGK